jgi:hypothetical protein
MFHEVEEDRKKIRKFNMKIKLGCISLAVALTAWAQAPAVAPNQPGAAVATGRGRGGGRGQAVRSPELAADQKVTFRLNAPNATEVTLNGAWPGGRGMKMAKDDAVAASGPALVHAEPEGVTASF